MFLSSGLSQITVYHCCFSLARLGPGPGPGLPLPLLTASELLSTRGKSRGLEGQLFGWEAAVLQAQAQRKKVAREAEFRGLGRGGRDRQQWAGVANDKGHVVEEG